MQRYTTSDLGFERMQCEHCSNPVLDIGFQMKHIELVFQALEREQKKVIKCFSENNIILEYDVLVV